MYKAIKIKKKKKKKKKKRVNSRKQHILKSIDSDE
jgi:hypothetical protein